MSSPVSSFNLIVGFWKLPYRGSRLPWLWIVLKPTIRVLPYFVIQQQFSNPESCLILISIVISSNVFSVNLRNMWKLPRLNKRLNMGKGISKKTIEYAYFFSTVTEYFFPILFIGTVIIFQDSILIKTGLTLILLNTLNIYLALRIILPIYYAVRTKNNEFLYGERYASAALILFLILIWTLLSHNEVSSISSILSGIPILGLIYLPVNLFFGSINPVLYFVSISGSFAVMKTIELIRASRQQLVIFEDSMHMEEGHNRI